MCTILNTSRGFCAPPGIFFWLHPCTSCKVIRSYRENQPVRGLRPPRPKLFCNCYHITYWLTNNYQILALTEVVRIFHVANSSCNRCALSSDLETLPPVVWSQKTHGQGAFLPEVSFGLRVLSLPACMYVCVRLSVNHKFVRTITHQPFKLGSPNLDQRCKRPWLRALLFCGMIDHDLQGQIELQSQNLPHFELVHAITYHQ